MFSPYGYKTRRRQGNFHLIHENCSRKEEIKLFCFSRRLSLDQWVDSHCVFRMSRLFDLFNNPENLKSCKCQACSSSSRGGEMGWLIWLLCCFFCPFFFLFWLGLYTYSRPTVSNTIALPLPPPIHIAWWKRGWPVEREELILIFMNSNESPVMLLTLETLGL